MSILAVATLLVATPIQAHKAKAMAPVKAPLVVTTLRALEGVRPYAYAAAPTGSLVAMTTEDGGARVVNAATGQTVFQMKDVAPGYGIAWSHNGKWIATGDESGRIYYWNAKNGKPLKQFRPHIRGVEKLSFNANDTYLMSTGKEDVVKIFVVATNKLVLNVLGNASNLYGAEFAPNSNDWTVGFLGAGARLYSIGGKLKRTYVGHENLGVWDVDYNRTGTRVVTAGKDNHAIEWDTKTGAKLGTLVGHSEWVDHVAFSPNGALIATSSQDRSTKIFSAITFQKVGEVLNTTVVSSPLCFTADGKYLMTVNEYDFAQTSTLTPPQAGAPVKPVKAKKTRKRRRH